MLGDDAQPAESARRNRATSGPRHAAPRKSLLTKLHMPAGKAVALAAMPTAVLMGMGFTPHLAQADEPDSTFKPGPCVTQPDTPAPSATDTAKDTAKAKSSSSAGDSSTAGAKATPKPTTSPSASDTSTKSSAVPKPTTSPSAADTAAADSKATAEPSATPSPTKSVNPLDPLGLGDLLGGLLGAGGSSQPSATPTPTASATAQPSATATPKATDPAGAVKDTVNGATTTADGALPSAKDTVKDTVKSVTDGAAKATGSKTSGTASSASSSSSSGGAQSFPCPTYDAKALADAETEQGIPLLADDPWVLKSSLLTLYDLKYEGIVKVRTYNGTVKDVLKFTASGIDIGDLHQIVDGPKGTKTHVTSAAGSTSTIRNGTVTMYTESISGNLLGLVPITFTPKAPPPLTLPVTFFTDATVVQAAQFGGNLHVPGMRVLPGQSS
ncbi:MAG: hydrogenase expression protein HypF [Streptomyces sp.]|nr:hydrogenase expression protein HypF [Streptomyces sp.]